MLQPKIEEAGFTLLEVIIATAISAMVIFTAGHVLNNQFATVSELKEKYTIQSVRRNIIQAIDSPGTQRSTGRNNPQFNNCLRKTGQCQANRAIPLQISYQSIIYAGTRNNPRTYNLPPQFCRSKNIAPDDCKLDAYTSFRAHCPPSTNSSSPDNCNQASDITFLITLSPRYRNNRPFRTKYTLSVLSKKAAESRVNQLQCPAFALKKTRRRGGDIFEECECKPGYRKEALGNSFQCINDQQTGCLQDETYRGFEINGAQNQVQPDCEEMRCIEKVSSQFIQNGGSIAINPEDISTLKIECDEYHWLNSLQITDCRAPTCFFKARITGDRKCYRDPATTQIGVPIECTIRYSCCTNLPN